MTITKKRGIYDRLAPSVLLTREIFAAREEFSCTLRCDGRELPDGRTERGEERRDHLPPGWGEMVAMRAGELADQPVRAKQAQLAADPGRAAACKSRRHTRP